ncbi:piggyBac transposable element-derived protein 3-like [Etheostoma spectabile]|uniref:piggyBac transposable element-derived protein 3-like n=1 Tax=Etheostoma spectabile TaxID=54343 RepID=UPI0013AF06D5|nr:piggyBac transposable element-derived protein 3-like [Etheostoma spectabile]
MGKDGTAWTVLPLTDRAGRKQSQNVLTEAAGPTAHAKRNIEDALTAFVCLFDNGMLKHIRDCTVAEAHRHLGDSSWDMTVAELKAFIALLYVRGAQGAKHINVDSLWSEKWGLPFFTETMARNRFRELMKFLRFDKKETRRIHLQDDKFALVSATWNKFVANSIACYKPGADITIDEQLFPTKARCKFIQYMGNKPDKFGIKFWLAADVQSKYMLNGAPYLGKEETRSKGQLVGESVVLKLAEPFLGKGRNITTDNFFTSLKLATALQAKKTSLVGTLGKAKRELPPSVKEQAELFSTKVLKCANATLTIYQGKPRKNVCILSSVHTSVGITDGPKAKPESVTYYNNTKYGVDVLDQMAKAYSVKGGTRRWPVAVFYNILDLAGINAHVLYKECTGSKISRRKFLLQLAEELRAEFIEGKRAAAHGAGPQRQPPPHLAQKRRQCQVRRSCNQNKTQDTCNTCRKPVCGNCVKRRAVTCVDCV